MHISSNFNRPHTASAARVCHAVCKGRFIISGLLRAYVTQKFEATPEIKTRPFPHTDTDTDTHILCSRFALGPHTHAHADTAQKRPKCLHPRSAFVRSFLLLLRPDTAAVSGFLSDGERAAPSVLLDFSRTIDSRTIHEQ